MMAFKQLLSMKKVFDQDSEFILSVTNNTLNNLSSYIISNLIYKVSSLANCEIPITIMKYSRRHEIDTRKKPKCVGYVFINFL